MSARNVLLINERDPRNPLAGGAEVHIFEIFKRLAAKGHSVTMLAASFPGCARRETIDGIHVRRLANRYLFYGIVPLAARRAAQELDCDVVVDVLNKLPYLSPWFVGTPVFAIVHHLMGATAFRQVAFPVALVSWLTEKLIPSCYRNTRMLAISSSTRAELVARGLPAANIEVVPPGLDHDRYIEGPPSETRAPLVVWVGRLEPYKRPEHALAAMVSVRRRIADAELVVIGDGSMREQLMRSADARTLGDAVRFTGFVAESEKIEWLQQAALIVNTSEKEGWGMTVIEGNACGAPTVSSDVPGLCDSVRHGETGILYPYGDIAALTESIATLLTDVERRAEMARAARRWAMQFRWDEVASEVDKLLEQALVADCAERASA